MWSYVSAPHSNIDNLRHRVGLLQAKHGERGAVLESFTQISTSFIADLVVAEMERGECVVVYMLRASHKY